MIAIIDYGMGNLGSVAKAFSAMGAKVSVTEDPDVIYKADKIVLPGVGAFRYAMDSLKKLGLIPAIIKNIESGKPYLGLCLGMQILFEKSDEGRAKGLGIFKGKVIKFRFSKNQNLTSAKPPEGANNLKIPHMGWNQIKLNITKCPLLKGVPDGSWMYFVHSYYAAPKDGSIVAATTNYGIEFASMIWKDNIYATQFHPEKSQGLGMELLENFVKL
ncbi:MAG: imidazole glycerol phosphate synthase subunit HisH [Candidatus Omnitrophica bacterium]|nr:imidazole glycerol phosphate synthase subunit HisH [Candidatus Omnitrophota bacterium]